MERIKLGLIGLNFGRHILLEHLIKGAGRPYFEVAGVCSQDLQRTEAVSREAGVPAYVDLEELLADSAVRAVGVFSGPAGRADLLRQVIRAGKDVMTTKPFEVDPQAARDVLNEAKSLGRVIHLNSPAPLLTDDLQQITAWQQSRDLGRPVACRADVWCSYNEMADGSWYDDPQLCPVAPVFRLGIYMINDLVRLFGPATHVQVTQSRLFTGRPTPDNAQLTILFANGAIANVFASFCINDGEPYRNGLTLNYERGTVYRNGGPLSPQVPPGSCELSLVTRKESGKDVERVVLSGASGLYQWQAFYDAVRGQPLAGEVRIEQIVQGLEIIRAMQKAQTSGATEAV